MVAGCHRSVIRLNASNRVGRSSSIGKRRTRGSDPFALCSDQSRRARPRSHAGKRSDQVSSGRAHGRFRSDHRTGARRLGLRQRLSGTRRHLVVLRVRRVGRPRDRVPGPGRRARSEAPAGPLPVGVRVGGCRHADAAGSVTRPGGMSRPAGRPAALQTVRRHSHLVQQTGDPRAERVPDNARSALGRARLHVACGKGGGGQGDRGTSRTFGVTFRCCPTG